MSTKKVSVSDSRWIDLLAVRANSFHRLHFLLRAAIHNLETAHRAIFIIGAIRPEQTFGRYVTHINRFDVNLGILRSLHVLNPV